MANVNITKDNCTIDSLYQWDRNQELVISGLELTSAPEVHFARDQDKLAIVRQATLDADGAIRVEVPNNLLQKKHRINAYVYTREGEAAQTVCRIVIPVIGRAKPADWEGEDEVEVYSLDALGVEVFTLDAEEEATVEKVLNGDGSWTLRFSIPRGADGEDGNGVPAVSAADNGKVLGVVDGKVALVTPSYPVVTQNGTKLSIE